MSQNLKQAFESYSEADPIEQSVKIIGEKFASVSEAESKIGDVITYRYTLAEATRLYNKYAAESGININKFSPEELNDEISLYQLKIEHLSIVLLKSKDGTSVQNIIEKRGKLPVSIATTDQSNEFEPIQIRNSPANSRSIEKSSKPSEPVRNGLIPPRKPKNESSEKSSVYQKVK